MLKKRIDDLLNKLDNESYRDAIVWQIEAKAKLLNRTIFCKRYWKFVWKALSNDRDIDYDLISRDFSYNLLYIIEECCKIYLAEDHIVNIDLHKWYREFLQELLSTINEFNKREDIPEWNFSSREEWYKRMWTDDEYEQRKKDVAENFEKQNLEYEKLLRLLADNPDHVRKMWW